MAHDLHELQGSWSPSSTLAYGIARASFIPLTREVGSRDGITVDGEELNVHQVPLEVGDEVYVVEIFQPSLPNPSSSTSLTPPSYNAVTWYRGYVVSSSPRPRLPSSSHHSTSASRDLYSFPTSSSVPTLSDEPQVSLGIFPAMAVTIREHLSEDAEKKLGELAAKAEQDGSAGSLSAATEGGAARGIRGSGGSGGAGNGRMDTLEEEDEDEYEYGASGEGIPKRLNGAVDFASSSNGKATRSRNRSSVGSLASFAQQLSPEQKKDFQASRLSQQLGQEHEEDLRPPPPLPNLKCGDETASGVEEPLVDEIACALREWASLLYTHLYRRDYALFESVKDHINALHGARKQLLARTLSVEESERLRKDAVQRLVKGNLEQGLEVIVRHPGTGGLVDVGAEGEQEQGAWMSVVRMYAAQVALAYGTPLPEISLSRPLPLALQPSTPNLSLASPDPSGTSSPTSSPASRFHHVFLDLRAFVAAIASPGEFIELSFSLFAKSDSRFVTEEFCQILNHDGAPARESANRFGQMKTLFRDLSQHDVSDQLYLVCRIVKNVGLKGNGGSLSVSYPSGVGVTSSPPMASRSGFLAAPGSTRSDTGSFDSGLTRTTTTDGLNGVEGSGGGSAGMLWTDGTGRQSYRRPFGCAVLEISQFNKRPSNQDSDNDLPWHDSLDSLEEHQIPIFIPSSESAFATLHEDIIHSRIQAIAKSPQAEHVAVSVKILHGDVATLQKESPLHLTDVPCTARLGFPDVVLPGDQRNEVYLKLWSGEFGSAAGGGGGAIGAGTGTVRSLAQLAAAGGGGGSIEVSVELRNKEGATVERVLSRGTGEANVSQYTSMVYKGNNNPTWGELVKLAVEPDVMEDCHLFLTFRNRIARNGHDLPFAFGYFPLFLNTSAFQPDGSHSIVLYKYDRNIAAPSFYFQVPPTHNAAKTLPPVPPSVSRTLIPLKDTMVVRTFLVSTTFTQDETLLRLLKWETDLLEDKELLKDTLTKLRFCSEVEVCKFLRDIFDALFGILVSAANQSGEMDDLVFQAIVTVFGYVNDRRFHFRTVLDLYIAQQFSGSTAASHIIQSLQRLLRSPASPENATTLRSSIKVLKWLFRLVVRSREIQRTKGLGSSATSETLEAKFKNDISSLLSQVNSLMRTTTPSSIIGTQTLFVQNFASILPELAAVFSMDEVVEVAIGFVDSISATKGKMVVYKLLLLNQLVKSDLFATPDSRATLIPNVIRWLKPSLVKFDEIACSPKDPQATRDLARVGHIEGIRLAIAVLAATLDAVHLALVDPEILANRSLLAQEHDNVEYLAALLPLLAASHRELENLANLDAIERQRTPASIPATIPAVFPSSYPISLISYPADYARRQASLGSDPSGRNRQSHDDKTYPTLRIGIGEVACVFLALVHLAPRKIFVNWLEATQEVEGKETFSRQLGQLFRLSRSILENEAFPADWLNISALAHRVVLKIAEPVADILIRDFVPPAQASFKFNTALWRDFFGMLLKLLSSPQVVIEEFSSQKRRAMWRLAGDIRGEGAKILARTWSAIAGPGYQVQFVPGLVEGVLSLCLSHHDELRRAAVQILHSMIVSEYTISSHFAIIEQEVIDKLDRLFGVETRGDEMSRTFFVAQLRQLFDDSDVDDKLREQVESFLSSIDSFLDLLLAVRNLPEGEEFQEDRIISTLRLMTFIRGIGRSEIFIRYVQRLVSYHVALGNDTEAGLTLKLHADLHEWSLAQFVEPLPDLDLPRQTEFARKETLYMRILEHLSRGKSWEAALDLCKELQQEYEHVFNYSRLADLFKLQAELLTSIVNSDRHFGNYFRVAFYGGRWPLSLGGKQFIYRGQGLENLGSFIEHLLNKHPGAQLLKTSSIPSAAVQESESQFLQITAITPEVDPTLPVFANPDCPHYIRAYWQHNNVNTFSFTRPLAKDGEGGSRSTNDFASLWTEKTVLICEDSFPTVLRRSEIVEIRLIEISPVENALKDVEAKRIELSNLERRYQALSQTEPDRRKINSNPLSMALNSAVDSPLNQGVSAYRKAFLQPDFIANLPPSQVGIVRHLEASIDELVVTLARCLRLHGELAAVEMQPFHETLERFFEKNFADELTRLPEQAYEPTQFGAASSASSIVESTSSALPTTSKSFGTILVTSASSGSLPPSASSTSLSASHIRRESVSTHAANDQSLIAGASRAARQQSSTGSGYANGSVRAASVYSSNGGGGTPTKDGRASPTRSLFSLRSGSQAGGTSTTSTSGPNGHLRSSDAANGGTNANGVGRRASLFLSTAASGVKKLGRRKGSVANMVVEEVS
ncbi:hypothetical protein JCM11641_006492 [Rhodosporidiobolus odoratus]